MSCCDTVPKPQICILGSQTDVLEKGSACLIALAMREVDPEKLGAAAAVPLVIAMLHYELDCNNTVGRRSHAAVLSQTDVALTPILRGDGPGIWALLPAS